MPKKKSNARAEGLINTMNCARWLVQQFEELDCASIARIFQKAVDDADSWIQTTAVGGRLPKECIDPIRAREASQIHHMLVKYASIDSPQTRQLILQSMLDAIDDNHLQSDAEKKRYARGA